MGLWKPKAHNTDFRVLLEKLIVAKLFKKFPTYYGPRKFITVFARASHLSLSWDRYIQPNILTHSTTTINFNLILHLQLGPPSALMASLFRLQFYVKSSSPFPRSSHLLDLHAVTTYCEEYKVWKNYADFFRVLLLLSNVLLSEWFPNTIQVVPLRWKPRLHTHKQQCDCSFVL
jgi:hypothetical protein